MKFAVRLAAVLTLAVATTFASAAATDQSAVWKYVDASTFAVARMDLAIYDRNAFEQWFTGILRANTDKETADAIIKPLHDGPALALPDKLKQAGAKEMFAVLSMADIPASVGCVIIPIPQGARGDRVATEFFRSVGLNPEVRGPEQPGQTIFHGGPLFALLLGDHVLISAGTPDRYEHFTPADRPDLTKAFDAAGDAPIAAAFSPTDDARKVIEQMMPTLPPPASVPSTVLTHGLRSASLAATLPPHAKLNLVIQSDNPAAAADLNALLNKFLTTARTDKGFRRDVPKGDQILDAVTPKLDGDHLTLVLDSAAVDKVTALFAAGLSKARTRAFAMQSISNEKQILMGVMMYSNDHKGAFPDDLSQLSTYLGDRDGLKKITTNPQAPARQPGYVYLKPAVASNDLKSPADVMILHESFDQWPGQLGVGFADGHCQLISDQAEFDRLLKKAKAPVPAK